jgi:tRNA-specific 2-thiouridylase
MARDQSYFLFATTQAQADYLRFPLGTLTKSETRAIASELGLEVANKPDSQDICFVPDGNYADLIRKLRPDAVAPGDIVHLDGRVLGHHDGIVNFTIGQRRGLGIAEGEPLYVVKLDAHARRVIVGPKESLRRHTIALQSINWLGDDALNNRPREVFAKIRSTRGAVPASVCMLDGQPTVSIHSGEFGVSPGQACVLYDAEGAGARVLGGGTIAREEKIGEERRTAIEA